MGTAREGMWVAFSAVFWGGWMLAWGPLWKALPRADAHIRRGLPFMELLGLALVNPFRSVAEVLLATTTTREIRSGAEPPHSQKTLEPGTTLR